MAAKRIAVLVRDRQGEALRMALGLLLLSDVVEVYVLDRPLAPTDDVRLQLEPVKEMEVPLYTNCGPQEGMESLSTEEIARRLVGYDHALAY
ncbi:MAG: hypothetical protein HYV93_14930 [Candidatus Rokubacteria bacterium]|nr:hypothetical protein [Candidatus Rokubacteria bacterium]